MSGVPLLNRQRVIESLRQAAARRVTLVCAPAGAGKTIACRQWAQADLAADSAVWLDLDGSDRVPDQFWPHLRAALTDAGLGGELTGELPGLADGEFAAALARAAAPLPAPLTVFIDDLHELAGSAAVAGLDQLIRHAPQALRFVLIGRHPAGLAVARLRVSGDLAEIGTDDLACTPQEADDYLALAGLELGPDRRDELLSRTEGWMTGLRLAALPGNSAAAPLGERISGEDPDVADYLSDEVLSALPDDRRVFLTRASVAEVICGELADAVTGGTGAAAVLDQLARENLMIRPAAGGGQPDAMTGAGPAWYRCHPLLLDLLRARLRMQRPAEVTTLTGRAARWQAANGAPVSAIRNAALAGDWDLASRLLAECGPALLLPRPAAELEPVLARFPASRYVSDASVAGSLAAAGIRTGDRSAAALHLDNAQHALDQGPPEQRRTVGTWLQALRLMNADGGASTDAPLREQSTAMAVAAESAIAGAGERQASGLLWLALGVSALNQMSVASARTAFGHARRQLHNCLHEEFADEAGAWQAVADALAGNLCEAREMLGGAANGELADLAALHLHWAEDEAAAARRVLGQRDFAGSGSRPGCGQLFGVLATLARVRLALSDGDIPAANGALTRLRYQSVRAGETGAPGEAAALDIALTPIEIEVALRNGDLRQARTVLARAEAACAGTAQPAAIAGPGRLDLKLARARILAAEGDGQAALTELAPLLRLDTGEPASGQAAEITVSDQVSALITAAIAERRLGNTQAAAELLRAGLLLSEPHRLYRPFLDAGPAARSALTVLISPSSQGAAFAARILRRFDASQTRPGGQSPPEVVRLTSSELAVLRFLPSHMTNQEIAEALFLSINTVKTHLRSVYRKLGVTTRRQAIAYGGKLGLL